MAPARVILVMLASTVLAAGAGCKKQAGQTGGTHQMRGASELAADLQNQDPQTRLRAAYDLTRLKAEEFKPVEAAVRDAVKKESDPRIKQVLQEALGERRLPARRQ